MNDKLKKTVYPLILSGVFFAFTVAAYYFITQDIFGLINRSLESRVVTLRLAETNHTSIIFSLICFTFIVLKGYFFKFSHFSLWANFFSIPLFSTFSQILWVGIGIYFSLQSSSLTLWWKGDLELTSEAIDSLKFAISFLVFSSLIFLEHQLSLNSITSNLSNESKEKITQLENVIQLAPPGDFSALYARYVDHISDWTYLQLPRAQVEQDFKMKKFLLKSKRKEISHVQASDDLEELKTLLISYNDVIETQQKHIRAVLICFARLAAVFDKVKLGESSNTYRANIMIKKGKEAVNNKSSVNFLPSIIEDTHTHCVDFYLSLDPVYSVSIYSSSKSITRADGSLKSFNADDIQPLLLPVFSKKDDMIYNCFGAPRAVATGESQFVPDTHLEVKEWQKENPGKQVITAAKQYYYNSKKARAILSIPLAISRITEDDKSPNNIFGSINIYRNTSGLLSANDTKKDQFVDILTPLTQALASIIYVHLNSIKNRDAIRKQLITLGALPQESCDETSDLTQKSSSKFTNYVNNCLVRFKNKLD